MRAANNPPDNSLGSGSFPDAVVIYRTLSPAPPKVQPVTCGAVTLTTRSTTPFMTRTTRPLPYSAAQYPPSASTQPPCTSPLCMRLVPHSRSSPTASPYSKDRTRRSRASTKNNSPPSLTAIPAAEQSLPRSLKNWCAWSPDSGSKVTRKTPFPAVTGASPSESSPPVEASLFESHRLRVLTRILPFSSTRPLHSHTLLVSNMSLTGWQTTAGSKTSSDSPSSQSGSNPTPDDEQTAKPPCPRSSRPPPLLPMPTRLPNATFSIGSRHHTSRFWTSNQKSRWVFLHHTGLSPC
mmetsp:Transcript_113034/g.258946  ORF Transcript_113034/g.258946 Transcript_113034/m.258946 type:complete len:293 (-) Transcript_113034:184-1062(-)